MQERERKEAIQRLVRISKRLSVQETVKAIGVSESTIRRDIADLVSEGVLVRFRGGIETTDSDKYKQKSENEPPLDQRMTIFSEKKRRIAKVACSLIEDSDVIMIDGGTTTFRMVEFLDNIALNVITNSLMIAENLSRNPKINVSIPEGTIDFESRLIFNHVDTDPFRNYNASKIFMGIEGLTGAFLTNSKPRFIQTKIAMMRHGNELIILADDSKFGRVGLLNLCNIDRVSKIITTKEAELSIVNDIRSHGVEVILA